jgi:DNA-binding transcriptional LysR family regulator
MEISDLQVFVRIVECRSLSAAARLMHLPKSSVSRALSRLEDVVGAVLIDRSARPPRPTDAGATLHPHAQRILADAEEAQAALDALGDVPRGVLKVNAGFTFAVGMLAPMLADFLKRYPEVSVVLDVENRRIDVAAEEVDIALRIGKLENSELVARWLSDVELWTCASPAYLQARGTPQTPADLLQGHDLVVGRDRRAPAAPGSSPRAGNSTVQWSYVAKDGDAVEVDVVARTVIPEPTVQLPVLLAGCGIGRLPDFLASAAVASGQLVRLFPALKSEVVSVHAVYTGRKTLPTKARVFIEALSDHLASVRTT